MTPCKKCGYNVGDWFVLLSASRDVFLYRDDGSESPWFKDGDGKVFSAHLMYVRAKDPVSSSNIEEEAKKQQFNPGQILEADWKSNGIICGEHAKNGCVVFIHDAGGIAKVAYAYEHGGVCVGYIPYSALKA